MRTGRRGSGRDDQCDGRGWGQDEVVEAQIRAFRERGKDHGESSSPVREEVSNGSNPIPSLYSTAASTLRKNPFSMPITKAAERAFHEAASAQSALPGESTRGANRFAVHGCTPS